MEELLNKLGINAIPNKSTDGTYVIDLKDSNEYGRMYSKLDRSEYVEEDDESSQLTTDTSSVQFISEEYNITLTLLADFNTDQYKLTIRQED